MAETYNRLQALFFEKPVSGLTPAEKRQRAIIERARLEGRETYGLAIPEQ
jgi:hypothetical protein